MVASKPSKQAGSSQSEEEIYGAFSAILDEVDRMFSITTLGKWLAMSRIRARGTAETLGFMERVASLGFQAVVTPEERTLLNRLLRETEVPEKDRRAWEKFQAKLRRMKFTDA
ncbi:MAG: hypothetical protein HY558_00925 [Euryarchaeota archaeon]|nr:hypothetical protein [Euryarchaeota archaeon]